MEVALKKNKIIDRNTIVTYLTRENIDFLKVKKIITINPVLQNVIPQSLIQYYYKYTNNLEDKGNFAREDTLNINTSISNSN